MSKFFSPEFWDYAGERAIKTFAQTALAYIGTSVVGLFDLDWTHFLSITLLASFLSVLTSIVNHK